MNYREAKTIIDKMYADGRLPHVAIHMLFPITNACPNKDKTGSQKTAMMDGVRTMIADQAKRMVMRKCLIGDDEIRTRETGRILLARYKKAYKDKYGVPMPEDLETLLITMIVCVLKPPKKDDEKKKAESDASKKEEPVEDRLRTQMLVLARSEVDAIYEEIEKQFEAVISGETTPEEAAVIARDVLIKTAPERGFGIAIALFGRMSTDKLIEMTYAAIQSSHIFAVNARVEVPDYFTAKDDFNIEILNWIDNKNEIKMHNGAGMMDEEFISSDVMYEFHAINMKTLLQTILTRVDASEPDAVEKAYIVARAGVAKLIRCIVDLRAEGGMTRHYDMNTPNCLAVYLSNSFARTASGAFWRAIDRKVADTKSIEVLSEALDEHRFRTKYEIRKGYWVVEPRFDDIKAPEGYERTTVDDIVDMIENEKWDHDFTCKE